MFSTSLPYLKRREKVPLIRPLVFVDFGCWRFKAELLQFSKVISQHNISQTIPILTTGFQHL